MADKTKYINIDLREAQVSQVIQIKIIDGKKKFVLITIEDLKQQLENLQR